MDMDDELKELMEDYDLEEGEVEEIQDLADELGVDMDDAHEIWEAL